MKRTLLPFTVWAFAAVLSLSSTARAQNGAIQGVTTSATGLPRGGVNVAVCATLTTTGASVTNNVATLTFASNPTTAGFVASATLTVSGFTGGDTYFNGSFTISATSSTTISFPLTHANASAGTNGTVYQTGNSTQACAPLSTLYTDNTGGTTTPNPFTSDGLGNYLVWAAPNYYRIQLYGTGISTFVYPTGVPCVPANTVNCGVLVNANNSFTGLNTFPSINGIRFVDGVTYTTIASALVACPPTGVEIISTIPETFASDPFAAVTCPFDIWLIGGTSTNIWKTNIGLRIGHNGQRIRGAGPNLTTLQANSGTFPNTTAVISVGAPGPSGVNGSGVYDLAVDCVSVAGCIGIHLDGAQELSGTSNTQVVNAMTAGFEVSSAQGAGADQNRMPLDHIRAACSVSAAATCVPVLIASTAGARVVIRDVTAVTTSPTVTTDCIRSDSTNATVILEDAHVEECTNGFHHTATGGQFEVDGITGSTTTTTLVTNDSSSASYQLRQLILNSSTNTLIDTGRSITTASAFCSAAGVSTAYVSCADRAVPYQFPSSLRIVPPTGAGSAVQVQLLAGFTGATPAILVIDDTAHNNFFANNDGRVSFHGNSATAGAVGTFQHSNTANRIYTWPDAAGTASLGVVEYCGATSGATQACAKTVQTVPITVWGDVTLNTATSQSITTLPFTDALYSCSGSDLTTAAGIVSFNTYATASVTIVETGGVNTDHLRYVCTGH